MLVSTDTSFSSFIKKYFSDHEMGLGDCHIIIHSTKSNPKRGVTVSIGDFSQLRFNVWIKNRKDSMSFQIERSDGLSDNLTGILGETMRGRSSQFRLSGKLSCFRSKALQN